MRWLIVDFISSFPQDWLRLPNLRELNITTRTIDLEDIPCVLRASALPALRKLTLNFPDSDGSWPCPVLEGRFDQLEHIDIREFALEADAVGAVLQQPSLRTLHLVKNRLCNEGCVALARALKR